MKTELADRSLYIDGVSEVKAEDLSKFLALGISLETLCVDKLTPEIERYNRSSVKKLEVGHAVAEPIVSWFIPDKYKYIDLDKHLIGLSEQVLQDRLYEQRLVRLAEEIDLFISLGYADILRALIYIIDTMKKNQIVWGVGRGSSCSSYLLYLLGLHEVDPVKYEIPISDFIRPQQEKT